ncbi:hypothetical protein FH972_025785 [Carpinus fangiana]|uniref:Uncharacterized protein n=1 Tax=Carpinus fangiana TaxID=176857 RepID=A0A5N6L2A1_9ROSI|nr:hypothetical protein FH972_025785 [Carpinus fangiana]
MSQHTTQSTVTNFIRRNEDNDAFKGNPSGSQWGWAQLRWLGVRRIAGLPPGSLVTLVPSGETPLRDNIQHHLCRSWSNIKQDIEFALDVHSYYLALYNVVLPQPLKPAYVPSSPLAPRSQRKDGQTTDAALGSSPGGIHAVDYAQQELETTKRFRSSSDEACRTPRRARHNLESVDKDVSVSLSSPASRPPCKASPQVLTPQLRTRESVGDSDAASPISENAAKRELLNTPVGKEASQYVNSESGDNRQASAFATPSTTTDSTYLPSSSLRLSDSSPVMAYSKPKEFMVEVMMTSFLAQLNIILQRRISDRFSVVSRESGQFLVDGGHMNTAPDITWRLVSGDIDIDVLFEIKRENVETEFSQGQEACHLLRALSHQKFARGKRREKYQVMNLSAALQSAQLTSLQDYLITCKGTHVSLLRGTASNTFLERLKDTTSPAADDPFVIEQEVAFDLTSDGSALLCAQIVLGVMVANMNLYHRSQELARKICSL